ncbi:MAG: hypothetical protein ABI178_13725 [Rhodanobacter sp.]
MALTPPDRAAAGRTIHPARILLDSPLAAATRGRVNRRQGRLLPPERARRVLAMVGALLVHVFFLLGFVLGPAIEPTPPPPPPELALQVRLVEPPEPPPPPPVRGTPPRERGPRHQGRRSPPTPSTEASANTEAVTAPAPMPAPAAAAQSLQTRAPMPKPLATPPPPVSLPAPAPLPLPKPVSPAGEPPALAVQLPTPVPPTPPKFQPEPVRAPQAEGNRPILSPSSLVLSNVTTPAPLNLPAMAMHVEMPKAVAPVSVAPVPQPPAAPEVPRVQPLPLPAQPAPIVMQQTPVSAPAETTPTLLPQPQAPAITLGATEIQVAPATVEPSPTPATPVPSTRIDLDQSARAPATQPATLQPSISAPTTIANVSAPTPSPTATTAPKASATPASTGTATPNQDDAATRAVDVANDASRAPDATPQGSDNATVGEPAGVGNAPPTTASSDTSTTPLTTAAGKSTGKPAGLSGVGKAGRNQPGAREGEQHGAVGDYVQLKPRGDTEIMRHGEPNIRYQATRFDKDWTPEGESSIDTALRRAVEKTTVKRMLHLPRGVRVECDVKPLLPISLFSCHNPDPPAVPLPEKIYDRLNVGPAEPLAPATSSPQAPAPTPMIKFDNSAECSAARVAGGPLPPGCAPDAQPVPMTHAPASSSSSWVPASDQFH